MTSDSTSTGRLLRSARTAQRRSLQAVAEEIGTTRAALSLIECGHRLIPGRKLAAFARAYQLDARDLALALEADGAREEEEAHDAG